MASIRHRIADVRKQISIAFEQAEKLGATKLVAQIRALSQQLVELESALAQVSRAERRLVRLINKILGVTAIKAGLHPLSPSGRECG